VTQVLSTRAVSSFRLDLVPDPQRSLKVTPVGNNRRYWMFAEPQAAHQVPMGRMQPR